jgi:hypothetical protein
MAIVENRGVTFGPVIAVSAVFLFNFPWERPSVKAPTRLLVPMVKVEMTCQRQRSLTSLMIFSSELRSCYVMLFGLYQPDLIFIPYNRLEKVVYSLYVL